MVLFGEIDDADIDTVYVERYNLTLRHGISRLVRKSLCFSKCKEMLDNHLDVYQCYNNLIKVNSALTIKTEKGEKNIERTPCMAEGITDHIWTWKDLLMFKILPTIGQDTTKNSRRLFLHICSSSVNLKFVISLHFAIFTIFFILLLTLIL